MRSPQLRSSPCARTGVAVPCELSHSACSRHVHPSLSTCILRSRYALRRVSVAAAISAYTQSQSNSCMQPLADGSVSPGGPPAIASLVWCVDLVYGSSHIDLKGLSLTLDTHHGGTKVLGRFGDMEG